MGDVRRAFLRVLCESGSSMPNSPIRSRTVCPNCGAPLYYVRTLLSFLTKRQKRVCLARGCDYQDPRRFLVKSHGYGHDGSN